MIKLDMKIDKFKSYLRELTIVTIDVLIALVISNFKEKNHVRKYHLVSIKTINFEIKSKYSSLKGTVEKQTNFLDTIVKYTEDSSTIVHLFKKI